MSLTTNFQPLTSGGDGEQLAAVTSSDLRYIGSSPADAVTGRQKPAIPHGSDDSRFQRVSVSAFRRFECVNNED